MGRENEKEAVTGRWDPKHEDYFLEAKEWRSHKCLPEDELKEHEVITVVFLYWVHMKRNTNNYS